MQELRTSLRGCSLNINELQAVVRLLAGISRPAGKLCVPAAGTASQHQLLMFTAQMSPLPVSSIIFCSMLGMASRQNELVHRDQRNKAS